jgi:hypothetical protein
MEVMMSQQTGTTRRWPARAMALAAALAAAASCSKPAAESSAEQPAAAPAPAEAPGAAPTEAPGAAPAEAPGAAPAAPVAGDRYTLDKDGTQATLVVNRTRGGLTYQLTTQASDPKCALNVSGLAREKGGDSETREDEQGEMVEVAEFLHESKDCWVSISLESGKGSMAWISTADCPSVPESCWLNMFGPLRKP